MSERKNRKNRTPASDVLTPASDVLTPASDVLTPASDVLTPASDAKVATFNALASDVQTPASDVQTPASDVQTPASDVQTPASDVQTPASDVGKESNDERDKRLYDERVATFNAKLTAALAAGLESFRADVPWQLARETPDNVRDHHRRAADQTLLVKNFRDEYRQAVAENKPTQIKFEDCWINFRKDEAGNVVTPGIMMRGNTRLGVTRDQLSAVERTAMGLDTLNCICFIGLSHADEVSRIPDQKQSGQRKYTKYEEWKAYSVLRDAGLTGAEASFKIGLSPSPKKCALMAQRFDELRKLPAAIQERFRLSCLPEVLDENGKIVFTPPRMLTWDDVTKMSQHQKAYVENHADKTYEDLSPDAEEIVTKFDTKSDVVEYKAKSQADVREFAKSLPQRTSNAGLLPVAFVVRALLCMSGSPDKPSDLLSAAEAFKPSTDKPSDAKGAA